MANIVLTAIIAIAAVLVVVALLVWRRQKEGKMKAVLERITNERKRAFLAQWIIGIAVALMAAAFMFDGHILGENTSGIPTVIGIVGICLTATSNINLLSLRRR